MPGGDAAPRASGPSTLVIDIGGTGIKATVLDALGQALADRARVETPAGEPPAATLDAITALVASLPAFDRVSVGFPGVVRDGRVRTAANLGHDDWLGFDLGSALQGRLGRPTRVLNDADLAGFGVIAGKGVEMVVTLGTGVGTALYVDGRVGPHLELAHHSFRKGETYEEQLGNKARKRAGNGRWNRRVRKAVELWRKLVGFDRLYLGGGNRKHLRGVWPSDVALVTNEQGLRGGIALWRE